MNTNHGNGNAHVAAYISLLALQIVGAVCVVWTELPAFRHIALNPGELVQLLPYNYLTMTGTLLVMQAAYWYRLLCIPIPFRSSNVILNHLFLFLGRLSFIFGGTLFSLVVFRHLPELDGSASIPLLAKRGMIFVCGLFALFCVTLELERFGRAFEGDEVELSKRIKEIIDSNANDALTRSLKGER
jgi:hypothetical protein